MRRGNTHTSDTRRQRRHTLRVSTTLAVVLTALAGCTGGDPGPDWTPTTATPIVQPTPTPSADPATIKPERPTAMDTFDAAGAEATAVYYMNLYAYVYATGDLVDWRALSHPECQFCASVVDHVEDQVAAGQHSSGGTISISDISSLETDPGLWWSVDLELVQAPAEVRGPEGTVVSRREDEVAYHMDIAVMRDGDMWRVRAVDHREATPAP